jgi:hypothetical protein
MAKKPATKGNNSQTHKQGNGLFSRLGAAKIRQVVEALIPSLDLDKPRSFIFRDGDVLETNCILRDHKDDTPSCKIDCRRGTIHCYGAGCGYHSSNLLQWLQDATGLSFKEIATQVHTVTGVRAVNDKVTKELEELDDHQQMVTLAMRVFNEHLARCIKPPTGEQPYARDYSAPFMSVIKHTLDWLFVERGRDPKHVLSLPYGILPSQEMAVRFAKDILDRMAEGYGTAQRAAKLSPERRTKIEALFEAMMEGVDTRWIHCVTFHTGYGLTTPGCIRLRLPRDDKTDGTDTLPGSKFSPDDPIGYFGLYLPQYRTFSPQEVKDLHVIVVEGENDTLAYVEKLLDSGKVGVRVVASIGKHNGLDPLVDAGIQRAYLFGDEPSEDYGKGEDWLRHMLASSERIDARPFVGWQELREGSPKDPDDAIRAHGFDKVYALTAGANARYASAEAWALDRLVDNTAGLGASDMREKLRWGIEFGKCVRNHASLSVYLEQAGRVIGIPPAALRRELVKVDNTEEGYVARLADVLLHEFHRTCRNDTDGKGGGSIELFHRTTQTRLAFYLTDGKGMLAQLSAVFGDMWRFFKDQVGLPPQYEDPNLDGVPTFDSLPDKLRNLTGYLEMAMHTVAQGIPSRSECEEIGQGCRFMDDPQRPGTKAFYVLNGFHVYKGVVRSEPEASVDWAKLAGPSDGKYIFLVDKEKTWCEEIRTVEDLIAGNAVTREDLHEALRGAQGIFQRFWRLKHGETDAQFLAYHLAALATGYAYRTKSVVHFLGDTNAGKSTLLSFFGGTQVPRFRLVEAADYRPNYTAAFICQHWDRVTTAMLLDEFEAEQTSKTSHKGIQVENISELIRQIASEGGTPASRGGSDGRTRTYHLHTFVMLTSMLKATLPQDNNRRMAIEIYRNDGIAPEVGVFDETPPEQLHRWRRMLSIGLFKFVPELIRHYEAVRTSIARVKRVDFSVPARFTDNLVPAVAAMSFFGVDWETYLVKTFHERRSALQEVLEDTAANALVQRILGTPNVNVGGDSRASISQLLSREDQVPLLNDAGCGASFDKDRKLLIIEWYTITSTGGLLSRTGEYNSMGAGQLKHMFDQHPDAARTHEYAALNIEATLRAFGRGSSMRTVSALKLSAYVDNLRNVGVTAPRPAATVVPIRREVSADGNI